MDREFDSPAHQYKRAEQLARENADLLTRLKAAEARAEQYEKCLRNLLPYLPLTSTGAEAIRAVLASVTTGGTDADERPRERGVLADHQAMEVMRGGGLWMVMRRDDGIFGAIVHLKEGEEERDPLVYANDPAEAVLLAKKRVDEWREPPGGKEGT